MSDPTAQRVRAAGLDVELRRKGRGEPLLVIHGEFGAPGWLDAYDCLAVDYDVIVPSLPGYGASERPDWIMGVHDVATWITWLARDLGVTRPVKLIGWSLGGWIAAEIATVAPQFIDRLVLVGAMGLKPRQGEIFDYFLDSGRAGLRQAFHRPDESAEFRRFFGDGGAQDAGIIEQHREMTCRVNWKPYMHSLTLPSLLGAVATPTLVVWGRDDAVTPVACGEQYAHAIPGARLDLIDACGHLPHMERPEEFVRVVRGFFAGHVTPRQRA